MDTSKKNQSNLYILNINYCSSDDEQSYSKTFLMEGTEEEVAKAFVSYAANFFGMTVRQLIYEHFSGAWVDPAADHCYRDATDEEIEKFKFEFKDDDTGYTKFSFKKWKELNRPLHFFEDGSIPEFKYD